jgi:hypothetical protein
MKYRKHYTLEEARALLPQIRKWLERLTLLRSQLEGQDADLSSMLSRGADLGGSLVNEWVRTLTDTRAILEEFCHREIEIKDFDRGLLDFPTMVGGKEAFLCWEQAEPDIQYWHHLEAGFAGRQRLGGF